MNSLGDRGHPDVNHLARTLPDDRHTQQPLVFRMRVDQRIDLAQLHRVGIELIEKDGVEERPGDLRGRRIAGDRGPIRLLP